ncbi:MAG: AraC family transcriptional regulator [Chthoniobacterales bacterium]
MTQIRARRLATFEQSIPLSDENPFWMHAGHQLSDRPIRQLHVHQCLEIGYCHGGNGIFMIADKVRTFRDEDTVIIPASEPHFARSAPGTTSEWTWMHFDPVRSFPPGWVEPEWSDTAGLISPDFPNVFTVNQHPGFANAARQLAEELGRDAVGVRVVARALALQLLVQAHRQRPASHDAGGSQHSTDYQRLAPALQILIEDYARPLRIRELARRCALSDAQFRRVFRQTMKTSPLCYLHDLRVRTAASLLRGTSKSVLEISLEVGFESVSSFHRAFRDRMSASPRAWRRSAE